MACALRAVPDRTPSSRCRSTFVAALCAVVCAAVELGSAGPARAQFDEARTLFEQAEFEGALAALERVENGDGLSVAQVVELLTLRAELHLANGDAAAVERDMAQLLALAPTHALEQRHPPELHQALDRARAAGGPPLAVELRATPGEGVLSLDAAVTGDPGGVVRRIAIGTRRVDGDWTESSTPALVSGEGPVDVAVSAVGPGGAVLVTDGTRASPRSFVIAAPTGGGDDSAIWIGVGIGAAVVVAAVIAIVVVVASPTESDRSQPALPVLAPLVRF